MSDLQDYWDTFYASRASSAVPNNPSTFAGWVLPRLAAEQTVVEVGFGNARDSFWFIREGHPVIGYDFAESAVARAQSHADENSLSGRFAPLDLYDSIAVKHVVENLVDTVDRPAIYGRFLIHSLEDSGRHHLLDLSAGSLRGGGELYLEFRTGRDAAGRHLFGDDHFRIFLSRTRS